MTEMYSRSKHFIVTALAVLAAALTGLHANAQGLIRDTEIENYIREWTAPILTVAGLEASDVKLFIINDMSLNAFVANGQRIHLNAGLLTEADTAAQVKGVIAHETCHIACRHSISRAQAASVASRPGLVSIGLGILAIAAGAPDAGAALIASSGQFSALNFYTHTRNEEGEADTKAVEYLVALGQNPMGISEFFWKFRTQQTFSAARRYPYFLSHPLARDRAASTRALAEASGLSELPEDPIVEHQFEMMQAKLIGFLGPANEVYKRYPYGDTSVPARYAHAIYAMRSEDVGTAVKQVDALIELEPDNPYFYELKGQILFEHANPADSVPPLEIATDMLPDEPLIQIAYARSLIARNEEGDIARGEDALRDALIQEPNNAFAWAQLAIALDAQGYRAEAKVASAESSYNIGDFPSAYRQATLALKDLEPSTPTFRRASDIRNATDPALPENQRYWSRRRS